MPASDRAHLLRRAIRLETLSLGYNVIEAVIAIGAGWIASSIALVGFGFDSAIETTSAVVVFLRLRAEANSRNPGESFERDERRAERVVGATLIVLAIYVLYESVNTLIRMEEPAESPVGIVLAVLSVTLMPLLARAKLRTGKALHSRALIADSKETLVCTYLSFTLLLGLGLNAALGWWWADPVAALLMVPLIFREAREAWSGRACCVEHEAAWQSSVDSPG